MNKMGKDLFGGGIARRRKASNWETRVVGEAFETRVRAELCTLGMPWEPRDFVERAVAVGHPRSLSIHLCSKVMDMLK